MHQVQATSGKNKDATNIGFLSFRVDLFRFPYFRGKADGNRSVNILVVMDDFTKYAQAYVTPKQTAPVVAQTLWKNFWCIMDGPKRFLTDQGKSFENSLIRELCKLAQVKKLNTSPYQPESNGQCEHFNATLINILETLTTHAKKNWQE